MNCVRRAQSLILFLILLVLSNAAVAGSRKSARFAESVDLPATFDVDFQLASKQRSEITTGVTTVRDDAAGQVGLDVFGTLVHTQMISGFGLPYRWTFTLLDTSVVNASSFSDGEITVNRGLSRLIGANRGLWAAVISHEVAHVARRHTLRKVLYHEYIQQQIRYWQMRSYYGDKSAGWTVLALRISGAIAEKKLSRDLEHDADVQGMLLMARAGYHPDYVFAMHHLVRIDSGEQSKFGAFFSGHPRWETRDQRTDRAYSEALAEYNRLWPDPPASAGGPPPAVAFLGSVHGIEDKQTDTGDLVLSLSCRNVIGPIALAIHLTTDGGQPVPSMIAEYRDSGGNIAIHQSAVCLDKDAATPTIVHIPTELVPEKNRKLKAQIDLLGPDNELIERSKRFDVHFPKPDKKAGLRIAKVFVGESPNEGARLSVAVAATPITPALHDSVPTIENASIATSSAMPVTALQEQHLFQSDSAAATVSITSEPGGADIFVDSIGMGKTPRILQIKPGAHSIQIAKEGYADWSTKIDVEKGSITNVTAKLGK
jgi:hypothetical protein